MHTRSAKLLLQVGRLSLALDARIRQPISSFRSVAQPRFTFGNCRTIAVVNAELGNEVKRNRANRGTRKRRRYNSSRQEPPDGAHKPARRHRSCKDSEETIRRSQ